MKSRLSSILLLLLTATLHSTTTQAVQLTLDNFEALTKNKAVFIKFFAPWCGHCRAMAEDWEKLEEDWKDHDVAFIGEVDCTSDGGQPICDDFDVQGFPTLIYGDPLAAETYEGPRDYESLSKHAADHISKPICSVLQIEACEGDEKKLIEELQAKSNEDLEGMVQKVADLVQLEEADFDEKVKVVQEQYDAMVTEFNNKLDEIKKQYNYKYVEQIMTVRMAENPDAFEDILEATPEGEEL